MNTISSETLSALAESGTVTEVTAVAIGDRWALSVKYGSAKKTLAGNSTPIRTWVHLNSLVRFLAKYGLRDFRLDSRNYDPDQRTIAQPKKRFKKRIPTLKQNHLWTT